MLVARSRPPYIPSFVNFRRRKRSIHHAEAHADEAPSKIRVMEHPMVPQGHAPVVQTQAELGELVDHLRSAGTFAYDTEFIGEETFHPRICLVQVATAERVAIIDPTQTPDLSGIWSAICDERLVTLVHAGGQDVNAAQRAAGMLAKNVIDTQVGAALMGMPWPASLANTVESLTGHRLSKGHTFTDWDARPLTASQISYAADDVRYLPLVWQRMHGRLAELGRVDWARHECELEIKASESFDPESQVRRACRGMNLRPRVMTILRELVVLRYELARTKDVPPRTLLADAPLLDVARAKSLPACVRFATLDAYAFDGLRPDRRFDAAFAGCWWSHVPLSRLGRWPGGLHEHPAIFTAVNADSMEIYAELVPFDAALAQKMSDRAVRVIQATEAGELLPRAFAEASHFECKFCSYAQRCWGGV